MFPQVNNLVTLKMTFFALELFSGSDHENHSIKSGPFVCQESPFITFAAAFTVFSMSPSLCAVERKPASNCDGAR